jgi:hypothetical protein
MLGHESPKMTLETYADLFDTDLDALAQVLDHARTAALKRPTTTAWDSTTTERNSGSELENVPGTLGEIA